jgi:hypothetical protein
MEEEMGSHIATKTYIYKDGLEHPPRGTEIVTLNLREYGAEPANIVQFLRLFRAALISINAYHDPSWGRKPELNCHKLYHASVIGNNLVTTIYLTPAQRESLLFILEGFDSVVPMLLDMAKDIRDRREKGHFVAPKKKGNRVCPACEKNRRASSYCGNERICKMCHRKAVMNA